MTSGTAGNKLLALEPALQPYAWGSRTHIPELMGQSPSDTPVAEAWYGAHAAAPSTVGGDETLAALIEQEPVAHLGAPSLERFGARLPYLLKLLAAAGPLSIQVHPSIAQAREGCAREDQAGIARDAANRSFRDDNHKPELLCALTRFEAMVGFREIEQTVAFFDELNVAELSGIVDTLRSEGLGAALRAILTLDGEQAAQIVQAVVTNCRGIEGDWRDEAALLARLADSYPGDPGVLTAALLNRVVLEPGQAVYLGAGNLHAYVEGFGVEIMANSDNVLRGGLTPKHMDVPALLDVVDARPYLPSILGGGDSACIDYETPAPEFALTKLESPAGVRRELRGPEIILCAGGSITVRSGDQELSVAAGTAIWAPAALGSVTVDGTDTVFIAAIGSDEPGA